MSIRAGSMKIISALLLSLVLFLFSAILFCSPTAAELLYWNQANVSGFGTFDNCIAHTMATYEGRLYVGTENGESGTEIWAYDGASWEQVNADGFDGTSDNESSYCMATYENRLYVGTHNGSTGTEVWAYDGASWEQVNTDGFDGTNVNTGSYSMAVFNNRLYAGTENDITGTEVWEYDGTGWTQVNTDGFDGTADNTISQNMCIYDNRLYVGTANETDGCEIWEYDGTGWTQVNHDGFDGTPGNQISYSMAVYNNRLYAGTINGSGGEIWYYDKTSWSPAITGGNGNPANVGFLSMRVFRGSLYAGTFNNLGAEVWKYDGTGWTQVNKEGFDGTANDQGAITMVNYSGHLHTGTMSATGCRVWQNLFPSIEITTTGPEEAMVGDTITYRFAVSCGEVPLYGVRVNNTLFGGDWSNYYIGDLGAGESYHFEADYTVKETDPNPLMSTATATGSYLFDQEVTAEDRYSVEIIEGEKYLGSTGWYLAEGATGGGFDTWISIQNPGVDEANVDVTFTTGEGPRNPIPMTLVPESRATIRVAEQIPDEFGVSTIVTSDAPVVAERSMYWDKNVSGDAKPYEMKGGHSNMGTSLEMLNQEPSSDAEPYTYYFPEGATAGGFDSWILICNPGRDSATVRVNLMASSGTEVVDTITVPFLSRRTLHLDDYLPDSFGVATELVSGTPLVVERSMYWDPDASGLQPYQMRGGHSNAGLPTTSRNWHFAEGSTGGGFDTYILIQNPERECASVTATFMNDSGETVEESITMNPRTRGTLRLSDYMPNNFNVATTLSTDRGVVAERSTYWDRRIDGEPYLMRDGDSTSGVTLASTTWMVAEGSTAGGFDSWVLMANPQDIDVSANVALMSSGGVATRLEMTIPAGSRYSLHLNDHVEGASDLSALVEATGNIVVERAMYWDRREFEGIQPYEMMGGHSSVGFDP